MDVYFIRDAQPGGGGNSRPWCWRVHSTSTGAFLCRVEVSAIRWARP